MTFEQSKSSSNPAPRPPASFELSRAVIHPRFGRGYILGRRPTGKITIQFLTAAENPEASAYAGNYPLDIPAKDLQPADVERAIEIIACADTGAGVRHIPGLRHWMQFPMTSGLERIGDEYRMVRQASARLNSAAAQAVLSGEKWAPRRRKARKTSTAFSDAVQNGLNVYSAGNSHDAGGMTAVPRKEDLEDVERLTAMTRRLSAKARSLPLGSTERDLLLLVVWRLCGVIAGTTASEFRQFVGLTTRQMQQLDAYVRQFCGDVNLYPRKANGAIVGRQVKPSSEASEVLKRAKRERL